MPGAARRLVIIPSYNSGPKVLEVLREARSFWDPVWVVTDGSTDGTPDRLARLSAILPGTRVLQLPVNRGKGAAVLAAARLAVAEGFTHFLSLDSDGQHPPAFIPRYMAAAASHPGAVIAGKPVFGREAPLLRVHWRKMSNLFTALETLGSGIGDSLFGMRVYPLAPFLECLAATPYARRFDFDPEIVVRLAWSGAPVINIDTPVRYLTPEEGGVSHFRYLRDNLLLTWMHLRLLAEMPFHAPRMLARRYRRIDA